MSRLPITKTYKLFIDGKFPRSESGRSRVIQGRDGGVYAHVCDASRKDVRDAVTAARGALGKWRDMTAYNRGQILYRLAEMLEGKRGELIEAISAAAVSPGDVGAANGSSARTSTKTGARAGGVKSKTKGAARPPVMDADEEVARAIDRVVHYAGWADKYAQVLGSSNSVAGPYHNFTIPEPTGVIAVLSPDAPAPPLLGLLSLLAPTICPGNTAVVVTGESGPAALVGVVLAEALATSDVPPGVVNLLTGKRGELAPAIASHRDIDGVLATRGPGGLSPEHETVIREGVAENLKRVTVQTTTFVDDADAQGLHWIQPLVESKTIWHPSAC